MTDEKSFEKIWAQYGYLIIVFIWFTLGIAFGICIFCRTAKKVFINFATRLCSFSDV